MLNKMHSLPALVVVSSTLLSLASAALDCITGTQPNKLGLHTEQGFTYLHPVPGPDPALTCAEYCQNFPETVDWWYDTNECDCFSTIAFQVVDQENFYYDTCTSVPGTAPTLTTLTSTIAAAAVLPTTTSTSTPVAPSSTTTTSASTSTVSTTTTTSTSTYTPPTSTSTTTTSTSSAVASTGLPLPSSNATVTTPSTPITPYTGAAAGKIVPLSGAVVGLAVSLLLL